MLATHAPPARRSPRDAFVAAALTAIALGVLVSCNGKDEGRGSKAAAPASSTGGMAAPSSKPPGAQAAAVGSSWFRDATAPWGLAVTHVNGVSPDRHLIETMGSGACLFDMDGDGDLDLYLVASGSTARDAGAGSQNVLLRNSGGRFVDVSADSGADDAGYGLACLAVDIEGDDDTDLFVTNWGPDKLLLNDGSGRFTDAVAAGVAGPDGTWDSAAVAFDADGDEDLDVFVVSYTDYDPVTAPRCTRYGSDLPGYCGPRAFHGGPSRLLLNRGDGRFEESPPSVSGMSLTEGKSLGAAVLDVDDDGDLDVFVANDTTANYLYSNERNPGDRKPRFREGAAMAGVGFDANGLAQACMGVATGDVNGDGTFEIFVTNFALESNTMYSRGRSASFDDITVRSGLASVSRKWVGWGTAMPDVDLDGDVDLVVANGHVHPEIQQMDVAEMYAQPVHLFLNDGQGRFDQVFDEALANEGVYRGLAIGDIDGDGRLDMVLTQNGGQARLLLAEPVAADGRHWILVDLHQTGPNVEAIGATVTLALPDGRRPVRAVTCGDSYLSTSERTLHFGTGGASRVDVHVKWPDGAESRHEAVETDRRVRIVRDAAAQAFRVDVVEAGGGSAEP